MKAKMLAKFFIYRSSLQHFRVIFPMRYYSKNLTTVKPNQTSDVKKEEPEDQGQIYLDNRIHAPSPVDYSEVRHWNENIAVKEAKRKAKDIYNIHSFPDLIKILQNLNNFPLTATELVYYLQNKLEKNELISQKYIHEREIILKPDLAAAHFLVKRHGSVKFLGQSKWVGIKEKNSILPGAYVPGMFIEGIKAEGTNLYYEGLENLANLKYLSFLSLKNLKTVNDWFLDWISCEYYSTLRHLDLSGCKNVTYRGLSCFYRFESLETLNVEGVPDPPEFKLACLLLLNYMPNLDIVGIDLNVPEKIDPLKVEEPL